VKYFENRSYAIAKTCLTLLGDYMLSVDDIRRVNTVGFKNRKYFYLLHQEG